MSTHDAQKLADNPADRRSMTTDPNGNHGIIHENGRTKDGQRMTDVGTTHLTTNIDGKWYVCDTRGNPMDMSQAFATESEAVAEAQKHNDNVPQRTVQADTVAPNVTAETAAAEQRD